MQKLLSDLSRLYLLPGTLSLDAFQQHMADQAGAPVPLAAADGSARALVIPFRKAPGSSDARHWTLLCEVANALQTALGLPAPAVSISGTDGFDLWLSFETAQPHTLLQELLMLLQAAYCPELQLTPQQVGTAAALPPCMDAATGKWSAFIHPDLGASFADEPWLEVAPPMAGQSALLQHCGSISPAALREALQSLRKGDAPPTPLQAVGAPGLLLADATLEDIVQHLHSKNIEPTFRHLLR
ncbi:hypothetical protein [Massilia sp. CF038]|uniref:hypothetical protein n=1 Tax=Massilia sp. CF038 TaxID=1881045 RepID=UPI000932C33E|nr:hypothetical protein [Massilia sp. CF038]